MRIRLVLSTLPVLFSLGACALIRGREQPLDAAETARRHGEVFTRFYCEEGRWPAEVGEAKKFAEKSGLPQAFDRFSAWTLRPVREIELEARYRGTSSAEPGEHTTNFLARVCPPSSAKSGGKTEVGAFSLRGGEFGFAGLKPFSPLAENQVFSKFGPFGLPDISFSDEKRDLAFGFVFGGDQLPFAEVKGLQAASIARLLSLSVPEKSLKGVKALRVQQDGRTWRLIELKDEKRKLAGFAIVTSFHGKPLGVIARGPRAKAESVRKTIFDVLKNLDLNGDVAKPTPSPTRTPKPTTTPGAEKSAGGEAPQAPLPLPTAAPATPRPTATPIRATPTPAPEATTPANAGISLGVPGVQVRLPEGVWTARELQKSEGSGFLELTARRGGKMFAYLYALEGVSSVERLTTIARSVARKVSPTVVDGGRGEGACHRYELQVGGDITYLDACPIVKKRTSVLVLLFSTRGDAPIRESARSGLVRSVTIDE